LFATGNSGNINGVEIAATHLTGASDVVAPSRIGALPWFDFVLPGRRSGFAQIALGHTPRDADAALVRVHVVIGYSRM
jgi:hypothetical protein